MVLKLIAGDALPATARVRLAHAVTTLDRRAGDLVPGSVAIDRDGGPLCLMRPFVSGTTLEQKLAGGRLDVEQVVALAAALFATLDRVHVLGALHRNIKPSNIVFPSRAEQPPVLVDFGIPRFADGEVPVHDVLYLAPEQSGLIEGAVDARADLYAAGVVLHHALTGRPPFTGRIIGEVLRQHLTAHPPPLSASRTDVPPALEQMISRLLRKDPRDRYQTAAGALSDFESLAAALRTGASRPDIVVGSRDQRSVLGEPAFVGRVEELTVLDRAIEEMFAGRGGLVLIEAESGMGKTWLLEEAGKRAVARGAWLLHGRGADQAAQRPFQVLSGVAHELVAAVQGDPGWQQRLASQLGPLGSVACAILPELRAIFASDQVQSLGLDAHGETRSFTSLTALLDGLGSAGQPVVLLLDDGQWADDFTLRLLRKWQEQTPSPGGRQVLVLLSFRREQVPDLLRAMQPDHRILLAPFSAEDVRQEIASMAGELPRAAVDTVLHHSSGNPFLVTALVQGLVETGAVESSPSGWLLNPAALDRVHASYQVAGILKVRIDYLDPVPRRLLTVAAILGRRFDAGFAAALADMALADVIEHLERSRGSLVWSDAGGTSFTFVHDRVRDALLDELPEAERRRLHHQAAERIRSSDEDRVFELAYHFDAAGEPKRALPYALDAAERAQRRFALELAEHQYSIAERGVEQADRATRLRVARGLADTLTMRDRYDEAAKHYTCALALADTAREKAVVEERWAQLELRRGDLLAACRRGESALRRIGRWVPRNTWSCTLSCTWELAIQVLHSYLPRLFLARRKPAHPDDDLFDLHLYHGLNGPYFFSKGAVWAGWAHLRHLNIAERHPPSVELGRAYAAHAVVFTGFPRLFPRGLRVSRLGAELCAQLGDPWGEAQALTFQAMILHFLARFPEAVEVGRRAADLFDRTGDRWFANSGLAFAALSLYRMGELEQAVRLAQHIYQRGRDMGDPHALAYGLDYWSRASEGQVPHRLIAAERARPREHVQTSWAVSLSEGISLLREGRLTEAEIVFKQAFGRVRKELGFFHDLSVPVAVYRVTALRQKAERVPAWNPRLRRRLLAQARRAARPALRLSRKFRNNLPHALREAAYLAAMAGDQRRAREHIDQSIELAGQLGQPFEQAQSRQARGCMGIDLGWPGAATELEQAENQLQRMRSGLAPLDQPAEGAPEVTLSLIERYQAVLEAGHRIATALDPEAVYAELRSSALGLLRGERCVVLRLDTDQRGRELVPVYGDAAEPVSDALVQKALSDGQPVSRSAPQPDPRTAARSMLCAPIFVRGSAFACFYTTHRGVTDLFNQEAERVARFLATLAGAALENAEGFAHIQALSRTLETRVEERTGQLAQANLELERRLRQLRETQDQLVLAGKMAAIGTLVAGLSHELNNPLNVILGYAQTLLERVPDHETAAAPLQSIVRNALRCRRLVRALLDFSRTGPSARAPTAPRTLAENAMELVSAEARGRDVTLALDVAPGELPTIRVVQQEIESALLNLLSNALHATPERGKVTLGACAREAAGIPGVEFTIHDTGCGIPNAVLSQIFDPFFTTKPVGQGTGLGLSLTRRIVESHDGHLTLETSEREGTEVRVWLPSDSASGPDETREGTTRDQAAGIYPDHR